MRAIVFLQEQIVYPTQLNVVIYVDDTAAHVWRLFHGQKLLKQDQPMAQLIPFLQKHKNCVFHISLERIINYLIVTISKYRPT
jgi:hypothetical protein